MRRIIRRLQNRAALLLGLDPARRPELVRGMLHRPRGDAAGYWLQLLISAALATLGLALDSTAVVIGAMLIAPLMRPIVELAMGLATGSTPLVFRTGLRAIASAVIVVGASAGFARLLPFHEATHELLARTAPSILDLFVAAACALAGAYAVVIASSDAATTAAGTSIGISLVPPLCTGGYGLSVGDWDMAAGAALLFTANVTGIVTVASGLFVILGFGQVNIREEEQALDEDSNIGAATRLGRNVSRSTTRLNVVARFVFPLILLGGVAYPLNRAVQQISRRSVVRQRIAQLVNSSSSERIVQYSLDQSSRPITLRIVLVGDAARARKLESRFRAELAKLGEPSAAVAVWAVSDANAISALSARLDDVPAVIPPPPPPPEVPLDERVREKWPTSAGVLLAIWISEDSKQVRITHLGPEIGPAGRELLATALESSVPVTISERALVPLESDASGVSAWLPAALELLALGDELPTLQLCVQLPSPPGKRARPSPPEQVARSLVEQEVAKHPNATLVTGDRWQIVPQQTPCTPPPPPTK